MVTALVNRAPGGRELEPPTPRRAVGAGLAIAQNRSEHWDHETVDRYDEELGIMGGDMGAPNLSHPPPLIGAYSSGSAGASSDLGGPVSSGPFEEIE